MSDEEFDVEAGLERLQNWMAKEGYIAGAQYWLRCARCGVFWPGFVFVKTPLGMPCRNCRKLRCSA